MITFNQKQAEKRKVPARHNLKDPKLILVVVCYPLSLHVIIETVLLPAFYGERRNASKSVNFEEVFAPLDK